MTGIFPVVTPSRGSRSSPAVPVRYLATELLSSVKSSLPAHFSESADPPTVTATSVTSWYAAFPPSPSSPAMTCALGSTRATIWAVHDDATYPFGTLRVESAARPTWVAADGLLLSPRLKVSVSG